MTGTVDLESLLKKSPRVPLEDYRKNIIRIVDHAREKGIAPILVTVPNNPIHPYLFHIPNANPEVNRQVASVKEHIDRFQYQEALALLEKAQTLAPDYYQVHYLKGKIYQLTGKKNWIEEYETALENHPFPERLKKAYNEALIEIGKELDVSVVDLHGKLRNSPLGADTLFIDAAHPSPRGYALIADVLEKAITEQIGNRLSKDQVLAGIGG